MFKQMFDKSTSTLTYLIADEASGESVLIDPVIEHIDSYMSLINSLGFKLTYSLETHVHADHITGGGMLRKMTDAQTGVSQQCRAETADIQLKDGDKIPVGKDFIDVIATPGHTAGSISFLWKDRLMTGDALLINGCGRTDFQSGDAGKLYDCITQKLFTLDDDTLVYPGHDYNGRRVSNIAQEKGCNARLAGKSRDEFIEIMNNLNLSKPRFIDVAVPANRMCGVPEEKPQQG